MTIEIECYFDDDELTGIENDILYYINKYDFLTLTELQWIFKIERKCLKKELKKLINKSYLEQRQYHNTIIYFSQGDFQNSNREQEIQDVIVKNMKNQKISYENMFERLRELKLCFDKKIFDVIIHIIINQKRSYTRY